MVRHLISTVPPPYPRAIIRVLFLVWMTLLFSRISAASTLSDHYQAVYVPPHKITQRTMDEIVHYAQLTPVNAVVLHVKTPEGKLMWPSDNPTARKMGVSSSHASLVRHVSRLKRDNIHTIAKLDVFADHQLAACLPGLAVMDASIAAPWTDANGLHWSNPSDSRVWAYNIALSRELALMGFEEIQFDYVRFPSDGDLSVVHYPETAAGFSKSDCIQSFLRQAYDQLKPLGVSVSADIFGLTAWKRDDFGIGQVLEKMAPHLDVICPMFYPSHFPSGFLGKQAPGNFPELIMEASMRCMMKRTDKPIRPWVQGFWYQPEQIAAQINGIERALGSSWSIWSPTGRYGLSYRALAERSGVALTRPKFYPTVAELMTASDRSVRGHSQVVNYTSFKSGYSILSLEAPEKGKRSRFSSPVAIVATLEEGIMDQILQTRQIPFRIDAEPYTKRKLLSELLCSDLGKDSRRMQPEPIYIDWSRDCRFSNRDIPRHRLENFAQISAQAPEIGFKRADAVGSIQVAAITDADFKLVNDPVVIPPISIRPR